MLVLRADFARVALSVDTLLEDMHNLGLAADQLVSAMFALLVELAADKVRTLLGGVDVV